MRTIYMRHTRTIFREIQFVFRVHQCIREKNKRQRIIGIVNVVKAHVLIL